MHAWQPPNRSLPLISCARLHRDLGRRRLAEPPPEALEGALGVLLGELVGALGGLEGGLAGGGPHLLLGRVVVTLAVGQRKQVATNKTCTVYRYTVFCTVQKGLCTNDVVGVRAVLRSLSPFGGSGSGLHILAVTATSQPIFNEKLFYFNNF